MFPIRDTQPSYSKPVVTVLLIVVNVLVFLFQVSLDPYSRNEFIAVQSFLYRVRRCLEPTLLEVNLCGCYRHSGLDFFIDVFFAARIQSSSAGRLEDAPS